jgi:hypothetical protein
MLRSVIRSPLLPNGAAVKDSTNFILFSMHINLLMLNGVYVEST